MAKAMVGDRWGTEGLTLDGRCDTTRPQLPLPTVAPQVATRMRTRRMMTCSQGQPLSSTLLTESAPRERMRGGHVDESGLHEARERM